MATANQKAIAALAGQNQQLRNQLNDTLRLLDVNEDMTKGLWESLETSTEFCVALLLKLGGSTTLTDDDYKAVRGQTLLREETPTGFKLSVVAKAVGEAAAQAAVHEVQQH